MSNTEVTKGNPAVVGLAGFGITTLALQFHNMDWCDVEPIIAFFVFEGIVQLIAGFWGA